MLSEQQSHNRVRWESIWHSEQHLPLELLLLLADPTQPQEQGSCNLPCNIQLVHRVVYYKTSTSVLKIQYEVLQLPHKALSSGFSGRERKKKRRICHRRVYTLFYLERGQNWVYPERSGSLGLPPSHQKLICAKQL